MILDPTERAYITAVDAGDTGEAQRLALLIEAEAEVVIPSPFQLATGASWYAEQNIAVLPLHHVHNGHCNCRFGTGCDSPGKHPLTEHGLLDATTGAAQVRLWWTDHPWANIGIVTGEQFDAVDIDGLDGLVSMFGGPAPLVDSLAVIGHATTPRVGGHHLFVAASGFGNKTAIYPGVDYRGVGGYVVAPPSQGANGRHYRWITPVDLTVKATA